MSPPPPPHPPPFFFLWHQSCYPFINVLGTKSVILGKCFTARLFRNLNKIEDKNFKLPVILNHTVLQSLDQDARKDLTPLKLRAKAAKFAKATIKTQMTSFKVVVHFIYFLLTMGILYGCCEVKITFYMLLAFIIFWELIYWRWYMWCYWIDNQLAWTWSEK